MWSGSLIFLLTFLTIFFITLWVMNLTTFLSSFSLRNEVFLPVTIFGNVFFYILGNFFLLFLLSSSYLTSILNLMSWNFLLENTTPHLTSIITEISFPFLFIFFLITALASVFCLHYNRREFITFQVYLLCIFLSGVMFFSSSSFINLFFSYEMFLVPSFSLLYKFAKTRRAIEAAYLMFFWTQFGALFLILSFLYIFFSIETTSFITVSTHPFTSFEINLLAFCWLVGFGVKLPLWPFYGWLPKAHVEASTNFSIFLSGVLVKFAFFGLLKSLLTLQQDITSPLIIPILFIGLVDAVFKLFLQIDLKKIVAYSTVIEMHWLTICIFSGLTPLLLAGLVMLVNHALLSSNAFFLVDAINRRFKTRLITELSGLNFLCPKLFVLSLINVLLFLGFPGSLTFVTEMLFFTFFLDTLPSAVPLFLVFLYLLAPTFFFRSWFNAMFGFSTQTTAKAPVDLTVREFLSFSSLEAFIYYLGYSWQIFLY